MQQKTGTRRVGLRQQPKRGGKLVLNRCDASRHGSQIFSHTLVSSMHSMRNGEWVDRARRVPGPFKRKTRTRTFAGRLPVFYRALAYNKTPDKFVRAHPVGRSHVPPLELKLRQIPNRCLGDRLDSTTHTACLITSSNSRSFSTTYRTRLLSPPTRFSEAPNPTPRCMPAAYRSKPNQPRRLTPHCPGHRFDTSEASNACMHPNPPPPPGWNENERRQHLRGLSHRPHLVDLLSRLRQNPDDPARHRRGHPPRRLGGRGGRAAGPNAPGPRDG